MATLEQALAASPVDRASAPSVDNPGLRVIAGPIYLDHYERPVALLVYASPLREPYRACVYRFSDGGTTVRGWPVQDVALLAQATDAWTPMHDETDLYE